MATKSSKKSSNNTKKTSKKQATAASGSAKGRKKAAKSADTDSKKAKDQNEPRTYSWEQYDTTQRGLLVILLFGLAAISILSFVNAAGDVGYWTNRVLGWIFGWGRYATPILFAALGYIFLHPERYEMRVLNYVGLTFFVLGILSGLHLFIPVTDLTEAAREGRGGGYLGLAAGYPLLQYGGIWVTIIVVIGATIAGWLIMFNTSLHVLFDQIRSFGMLGGIGRWFRSRMHAQMNGYSVHGGDEDEDEEYEDDFEHFEDEEPATPAFSKKEIEERVSEVKKQGDLEQATFVPQEPKKKKKKPKSKNIEIPLELLEHSDEKAVGGNIEENKEIIQRTFSSFGIEVEMDEVSVGPKVSQYTLRPAIGVKLTQITSLQNDIALALAAHPIRVEAPIPGKSLVGIEVPNKAAAMVTLRDLFASKKFKKRKDNLALALGKDVSGKPFLASIAKMPHLLIAGATGAGKSVSINTILLSLIYQNSPEDLRLILVDPKRVELSNYNGLPHLLTPVITNPEKTLNALKWAVAEMDRRYDMLSRQGKRNIDEYNASVSEEDKMPYIVFVIDELADLMAVAAKSVEGAIVRLAQMSRAIGIHLILATQRPSVNVITGLIKANMPARMAFSVTSLVDSRTILDVSGAEKLLGKGDMLYMDAQHSKPIRVQGAFVATEEINRVVAHIKDSLDTPEYDDSVTEAAGSAQAGFGGGSGGDDGGDELVPQAKEIIVEAGKASASFLQRRLRVGYARAARILDILEEQGFIGPADGSKPREVFGDVDADDAMSGDPSVQGEMPPMMGEDEEDEVDESVREEVSEMAAASRAAVEARAAAAGNDDQEDENSGREVV